MSVVPFRPAHRQAAAPVRSLDRAAVTTSSILQIVVAALRIRYRDGDSSAIDFAKFQIETLLREEFHDVRREAINEIRTECE